MDYGMVKIVDSGQTIEKPQIRQENNQIYITDDNQYIVVDEIRFKIFTPSIGPQMEATKTWYTLDTYKISEKDFDVAKAAIGVGEVLLGIGDYELPEDSNVITDSNGQHSFQANPSAKYRENYGSGTILAFGVQLGLDILQAIANAIEYTYVQFEFQISSLNTYRVLIRGGTKSDTLKYETYDYYNMTRSYIDDIVPQTLRDSTIDGIKEDGYDFIKPWVDNISSGKSKAKLLVTEDELKISENEFYDGQCWLNNERRGKEYQMYIYTDENSKICQKAIVYSKEKLTIVKRIPDLLYYGGKTIELIEIIDAIILEDIDKDNSNVFWRVFEKAINTYKKDNKKSMKEIVDKVKAKNNIN